ncbi:DUF6193 family natural product biosynthesis protein [Actinomadura verrucosospora]|uniref:DUF6193 family natural product biosynthesis protein n=1 Tax=Actinomadura verrucosospora TaxID=46165 RepID=UPI003D18FADA
MLGHHRPRTARHRLGRAGPRTDPAHRVAVGHLRPPRGVRAETPSRNSRCTGFPYTRNIPFIDPRRDRTYRVVLRHDRSPYRLALEEADDPRDAVAQVVAHLPGGCGPAVAGTAHDLDSPAADPV